MSKEKYCVYCNQVIIGRSDKRFCEDRCRNTYYYLNNTLGNSKPVLTVNRILKKNWRILNHLNTGDKTKVSLTKLNEKGFDFNYLTRIDTGKSLTFRFCYDLGYAVISEYEVLLIRSDAIVL